MATVSSILAWRIPWTEEPDGPQCHKESDRLKQLSIPACTAYQASSDSGSSRTWSGLNYCTGCPAGQCDGRGVRNRERTSH